MRIAVALSVACICLNADGAELTSMRWPTGDGLARGIAHLQCQVAKERLLVSRGAILDIGARRSRGDVIVTTAHGLPLTAEAIIRDCVILGRESERYKIAAVWNAGDHEADLDLNAHWAPGYSTIDANDWAVLLTKARLGSRVGRLRSGLVSRDALPELIAGEERVWLMRPIGDPSGGECLVLAGADPRVEGLAVGLLSYSCKAGPGLSGAPLLVAVDRQPVVIGIHVGWRTLLGESGGVSIGRSLDSEIYEAINAAARQAQR